MFYAFSLVIPAGTLRTAPITIQAELVEGTIEHVEIQFWAGHRGNVHVRIRQQEQQLWPSNIDGWFSSEGYTIAFDEQYQVIDAPFTLDIDGYNEDTDYDHEVIVRFLVSTGKWTIQDLAKIMIGPVEVSI